MISSVNDKAKERGVHVGMSVIQACSVMLEAKKSARQLYVTEVVYESEKGRIILADSISFLKEYPLYLYTIGPAFQGLPSIA